MEITVKIVAPELCEAIKILASAMAVTSMGAGGVKLHTDSAPAQMHEAIVADLTKKAEIITAMPSAPAAASAAVPEVTAEPITATVTAPTPTAAVIPPPTVQAVPTAPPKAYTINDMHTAIQGLLDAGKRDEIKSVITGMGFASLSDIPADRHDELVTHLRGLGANI